jgi:ACS family hexuronate transporter-like MFS transporter
MAGSTNRKWWIAGLLFTATLLNYLDREVLSLVNPVLRKELSLTATGYSHVLTAFLLGYTFGQLLVGRAIDKIGARRSLLLAMIWWSTAGIAAATSHTAVQLSIFLFLMGLGEAGGWPSSVKAIQEWFPAKERALAVGFFNSGSSAGAVLAPVVVSAIALHYSWRAAFLVCGSIGFLWILPWLIAYPRSSRFNPSQDTVASNETPPLSFLLRNRRTYGVVLGRFFCDSIWYFYIFWLPDYFSRVRHFSLHQIGMTGWIPFLAAGLGNLAGGYCSGWLLRRGLRASSSRLVVMAGAALAMSTGIGIWFCKSPMASIALISFVVFAYSCWASNILTLPSDIFSSRAVATVVGFSGMAGGLGGVLTTLMAGWMIDHYSYLSVFVVLALLPLIASACSLLSWRSNESKESMLTAI